MINENCFLKLPINFKDQCLIYPPSINQIISDNNFFQYKKVLTLSAEELEDEFKNKLDSDGNLVIPPTPLEFLISNSYYNKKFLEILRKAFLFFIKQDVFLLTERKEILIGGADAIKNATKIEDLHILNEDNFFEFQNLIRRCLGENPIEPPDPDEDPRVKRIKAKARYRDSVKAQKGLGLSLETVLASICCMGLGITPLTIGEMSYASTKKLIRTYQEKEKYQVDIDSLLAGADSKKVKPKHWIRNLED